MAAQKGKPKRRRTLFSFSAPEASSVSLAGDFNQWDEKCHPMKKASDGIWEKTLVLLPGRYEYKFVVDDQWQCDPANAATCQNRYGTENNVIEIRLG